MDKKQIELMIDEKLKEMSYLLYDIDFERIKDSLTIRIYAQKENFEAINLDDCVEISRAISEEVDELVKDEEYLLEVCSPGIVKRLKKVKHYEQHINDEIEVKTYKKLDNQESKTIIGVLQSVDDEGITINDQKILLSDISRASNIYNFEKGKKK